SQLQEEHKQCLVKFYDNNSGTCIQDVVEMLTSKFVGLKTKESRAHEFLRDDCYLSFKKVTFWS
ncbi:hypothetical protein BDF20DRAFT_821388, partial [Mycotypha africana]|uniref:uncharacterized protein n=1 Tax=Mycotypha africana TaxID=64632 RepID=UPI0022FFC4FF